MKQLTRSGLASDVTFKILTAKFDTNRVNISSHLNQRPYDHERKYIFVEILGIGLMQTGDLASPIRSRVSKNEFFLIWLGDDHLKRVMDMETDLH